MERIHIGDVLVHEGEPDGGNPYRGSSLLGPERRASLARYLAGDPDPRHTYWFAPACGGARRLVAADRATIDGFGPLTGGAR